jgi:CheY-like chemotaxis protein
MLKIFILEDDEERVLRLEKWVREQSDDYSITHAESAEKALSYLADKSDYYDLLLLDHDLGQTSWVGIHEENTGSTVARYIEKYKPNYGMAIVHSLNKEVQITWFLEFHVLSRFLTLWLLTTTFI